MKVYRYRAALQCLVLSVLATAALLLISPTALANGYGEDGASLLLPVLSRWVHVLGAVVLLGGAIFSGWVYTPALTQTLEPEARQALREAVQRRWRRVVHPVVALLLLSGLYNYYLHLEPHQGDGPYHMLMGIKILMALAVFGLVSVLVSGKSRPKIEANRKVMTWVCIALGVGIVLIAGYLKIR